MEKQFNFPKQITVSQLNEIDGYAISTEICHRYNAHEKLTEVIDTQYDKITTLDNSVIIHKYVSLVCLVITAITLFVFFVK